MRSEYEHVSILIEIDPNAERVNDRQTPVIEQVVENKSAHAVDTNDSRYWENYLLSF